MENDSTYHILFCNIAYMKYYDGIIAEDIPQNGGRYVTETNDALEKDNFHVCEDGYCRGFVETKYKKGYYTKCLKTKYWFARIAAKNSLSPQVNRNSMQKRVLTTHPLAAKRAEGTASPQPAASPAA